jgi:broad specificity phosphatase PhoE
MAETLPTIYLARHGETEWSLSGQHTGLTDIPLTARGERNARQLGTRLAGLKFPHVLVSPLQRARRTCELAGFGAQAVVDANLVEWNYGEYEGKTSAEIRRTKPDWQLFRDGCPGGESLADASARADRVIARIRAFGSDALLFSSGHILRVLGARWCRLAPSAGQCFYLSTAALSAVGYEHDLESPVVRLWNDCRHVES